MEIRHVTDFPTFLFSLSPSIAAADRILYLPGVVQYRFDVKVNSTIYEKTERKYFSEVYLTEVFRGELASKQKSREAR